jgi:predicted transcriptional regulator
MGMAHQSDHYSVSQIPYETFLKFFDKIPRIEQDIYKYYCFLKFNQRDIADLMGLTQGAISHRLSRMRIRLLTIREIDRLCGSKPDVMFKKLEEFCDPFEIEILRSMYETTSQSHTARRLNLLFNLTKDRAVNQIKVKYRFERILNKLSGTGYYRIFNYIRSSLYALSEVRLPQFDRTNDG